MYVSEAAHRLYNELQPIPFASPTAITDSVFLGSKLDTHPERLEQYGIERIVNCCYDKNNDPPKRMTIHQLIELVPKEEPIPHVTVEEVYKYEHLAKTHMAMVYLGVPLYDLPDFPIIDFFDLSTQFIHESVQQGHRVMVHCYAGMSRSTAIVAAYLMRYCSMNAREALLFIKKKRSIIQPNIGFISALLRYEEQLLKEKQTDSNGSQAQNLGS